MDWRLWLILIMIIIATIGWAFLFTGLLTGGALFNDIFGGW